MLEIIQPKAIKLKTNIYKSTFFSILNIETGIS